MNSLTGFRYLVGKDEKRRITCSVTVHGRVLGKAFIGVKGKHLKEEIYGWTGKCGDKQFLFFPFPFIYFYSLFLSCPLFISFWLILCFGIRARYYSGSGLTPNKRRWRTFEERIRQCSLDIYMMSPLAAAHRLVKTTPVTGPMLRHVCIYVILCCKGIFTCKTVSSSQ